MANRSQTKSQNECGSPIDCPTDKLSPTGKDSERRKRAISGDEQGLITTLDFFNQGVSQRGDNHEEQPGNDQTFVPKTQEIEFVDDEVKSNDEVETRHGEEPGHFEQANTGIQLANAEEIGYQSGPENLEHTNEPMNFNAELVGKKRARRRTKRAKGEEPVIRKKNAITKCEHTDAKYYAKGMCTNCYFKFGREKRATCCPDKPKYAKGVCHNCYMKKYSKDKR